MSAKRGRGHRMPGGLRPAAWDRVVRMAAVAALGFALSACGGGAGSAAAGAAASQSVSSDSSVPTGSSSPASGATTGPGTSTATGGQSLAGSGSSGTSGSGTSGSGTSGSGTSSPPTASTGNVTINWNPPTQNTNGSPLTNLAGFKIHYGTASQKYTHTVTVSNPGLVTYVIDNLTPGTYYFAVTAYSSAGAESPLSSEVSTKVN